MIAFHKSIVLWMVWGAYFLTAHGAIAAAWVIAGWLGVPSILTALAIPAIEIHRRAPAREPGAGFFEYDGELGWRGRPRASGPFVGWEFTTEVRLNARG